MTTGTGPTAGGKYVLTFTIEGGGEKQLDSIVNGLETIANQAGNGAAKAIKEASKAVNELGSAGIVAKHRIEELNNSIQAIDKVASRLTHTGQVMHQWGAGVLNSMVGVGRQVLSVVGETERSIMQLKVLGRMSDQQARSVMAGVDALVAYTPFQTQELMGISEALVMGKVKLDAWTDATGRAKTLGDDMAKGFTNLGSAATDGMKKMKISATSIVADFAALSGQAGRQMPYFVMGLQRAFATKSLTLLRDQLSVEARAAIAGSMGSNAIRGTAEDALKRMYAYLQKKHAVGMSILASTTAEGVMSNMREIPMLIAKAVGGDPMDPKSPFNRIKAALQGMFISISDLTADTKWRDGITKGVLPVVELLAKVMTKVGAGVARVMKFFGDHPTVTAWTLKITAAAAATAVIGGALLAAAAGTAGLAIAFLGLKKILILSQPVLLGTSTSLWAMAAPMALFAAKAAAVVAGLYAIYKAGQFLYEKLPKDGKDALSGALAFGRGLYEAVSNWNGATTKITNKTAQDLEKAGLTTPFLQMIRAMRFVEKTASDVWRSIEETVLPAIDTISRSFRDLRDAFGMTFGEANKALYDMGGESDSAKNSVISFATSAAEAMGRLAIHILEVKQIATGMGLVIGVGLHPLVALVQSLAIGFIEVTNQMGKLGEAAAALMKGEFTRAKEIASGASLEGIVAKMNAPFEQSWEMLAGYVDSLDETSQKIKELESRLAKPVVGIVRAPSSGIPWSEEPPEVERKSTMERYEGGEDAAGLVSRVGAGIARERERDSGRDNSKEIAELSKSVQGLQSTIQGMKDRPIQLQNTTKVVLDGREIAAVVAKQMSNESDLNFTPAY